MDYRKIAFWGDYSGLQCPNNSRLMILINGEEVCLGDNLLAFLVISLSVTLISRLIRLFNKSDYDNEESLSDDEYDMEDSQDKPKEDRYEEHTIDIEPAKQD